MNTIPSGADVRRVLQALPLDRVRSLCESSGVPFGTAYKVRAGQVLNPRINTVRALYGAMPRAELRRAQAAR